MKYTIRSLMVAIATCGVMAATLRMSSPYSVLILLACVCGWLAWAGITAFYSGAEARRILGTASVCGFGYLVFYVITDTRLEVWIDALSFTPFAMMKGGSANVMTLASSAEFLYFQQKVHLLLAAVVACTTGWIASA